MKNEIKCKDCGATWESDFDDLNEWCPECFGDNIKLVKPWYKVIRKNAELSQK